MMMGFARNTVMGVVDKVIEAVKSGDCRVSWIWGSATMLILP